MILLPNPICFRCRAPHILRKIIIRFPEASGRSRSHLRFNGWVFPLLNSAIASLASEASCDCDSRYDLLQLNSFERISAIAFCSLSLILLIRVKTFLSATVIVLFFFKDKNELQILHLQINTPDSPDSYRAPVSSRPTGNFQFTREKNLFLLT